MKRVTREVSNRDLNILRELRTAGYLIAEVLRSETCPAAGENLLRIFDAKAAIRAAIAMTDLEEGDGRRWNYEPE